MGILVRVLGARRASAEDVEGFASCANAILCQPSLGYSMTPFRTVHSKRSSTMSLEFYQ